MIPFQLLALVTFLGTESPSPALETINARIREMPAPDWIQKELRGAPPSSQADTRTPSSPSFVPIPAAPMNFMQGLLGVTEMHVKNLDFTFGPGSFESSDDATMPLIGGEVQHMLGGGDKLRYGLEGGFLFGWVGNINSVLVGSGGVVISSDNDVFLTEGSGGLCADLLLGEKLRLYAGAGGLIDWAIADVTYTDPTFGYVSASGTGFGLGVYTRAGFDVLLNTGMRLGFCWRWFDTDLDMGGGIQDLQVDGMQYMLTFTKSM